MNLHQRKASVINHLNYGISYHAAYIGLNNSSIVKLNYKFSITCRLHILEDQFWTQLWCKLHQTFKDKEVHWLYYLILPLPSVMQEAVFKTRFFSQAKDAKYRYVRRLMLSKACPCSLHIFFANLSWLITFIKFRYM